MWDLDYKESWALKNWCFWTVVLEKTLESPLDCKEIQPVHPKRDQSWVLIARTDAEAETPILWPPHVKSWLTGKEPDRERLKAGGEDDNRGWNSWMASLTQWTWVWVGSNSWWWTGRPGVLQSVGLERIGHDWATELNIVVVVFSQLSCDWLFETSRTTVLQASLSFQYLPEVAQTHVSWVSDTMLHYEWINQRVFEFLFSGPALHVKVCPEYFEWGLLSSKKENYIGSSQSNELQ